MKVSVAKKKHKALKVAAGSFSSLKHLSRRYFLTNEFCHLSPKIKADPITKLSLSQRSGVSKIASCINKRLDTLNTVSIERLAASANFAKQLDVKSQLSRKRF